MPQPNQTNILTNLEINEVSFVDRGAIGERFSIIKMDDPDATDDPVTKAYNSSQVCDALSNMQDEDFIGVMSNMMTRYNEINKGGSTEMDENMKKEVVDLVTATVTKAMETSMETINKNFVNVNKTIDEIQKAHKTVEDPKVDPKVDPNAEEDKKAVKEVKKAVETVADAVTKLADTVSKMGTAMDNIAQVTKSLTDADLPKQFEEVNKKLETISSMENPANGLGGEIKKNDGDGAKEPFWKSFYGQAE
jgi:prefoldin subunit 5